VKRWYVYDRFARYSLIAIGLVVTISLVWGFLLDWKNFLEGVLASLAFSGITIVIGLFLVDRLIEHRQEQQWARVRLLTYRGLAAHLCDVVSQTFVVFMLDNALEALWQMLEGRNEPKKEALPGFTKLAEALREVPGSKHYQNTSPSDVAGEFYKTVEWELEQIQTILTPRLLQSATDQKLVEAIMEFDHANRTLYTAILAHKQAVTQSAFSPVVALVLAAERLYRELLPHWVEAEKRLVTAPSQEA
jgi:hypothetical protein